MVAESRSSTADLEAAREKLLRTVLDLDEWALDEPRMVGEWSLRELLAHLLVWDGWAGRDAAGAGTRRARAASR